MRKELTIRGEALGASQEGTLAVEQFLRDNYLFRFNVLSGPADIVTDKEMEYLRDTNERQTRQFVAIIAERLGRHGVSLRRAA
jgi:hypothetical protein